MCVNYVKNGKVRKKDLDYFQHVVKDGKHIFRGKLNQLFLGVNGKADVLDVCINIAKKEYNMNFYS